MTEPKTSQECFEEIKEYGVEKLKTIAARGLAHAEKQCTEFLTGSGEPDEKDAADAARQHVFSNRQNLIESYVEAFSQTLIGEKVVADEGKDTLSLSLVDDDTLDEMIIIGELTGRIQDYYDLHIKTMRRGLVRLSKEMDFEPEPDALTPKKLVLLLHDILGTSELKLVSKQFIYTAFADAAQVELKPLYDGVLALLQEHGTISETENPSSQNFKVIYQYRQQQGAAAPAMPADAAAPTAVPPAAGAPPMPAAGMPPPGAMPMSQGYVAPAALSPVSAQAMNPALFQGSESSEALYGFLSRAPQPQTDASGVPLPTVESGELLKLLSNLQNIDNLVVAQSALENASSISEHINQTITEKTREWAKQLSAPEANVIELVNTMFVAILEDPDLIDPVKVQIGRLQIPYIKVALLDVTLLNESAHPARLLLNELAQYGVRINHSDDPLMIVIQRITRNILKGFETDLGVFAKSLEEFRKQASDLFKEASDAEEKTRGKAESQAKVLHLKKHIVMRLRQYLKGKVLPKEMHALLLKGFAPLLLNIYRKEGEENEHWEKTVYLLRQTVESVQPRDSAFQLETVLERSTELMAQIRSALEDLPKKFLDNTVVDGLKAIYEQLNKKLGHMETKPTEEPEENKIDPLNLDKKYQPEPDPEYVNQPRPEELVAQLPEQLHAGAWCEVYIGRNEPAQKLKVSSILRESAQLVFVDGAGKQSQIKDIQEFLDELDCERSRIIPDEFLFDKALTAVINNMNLMRATA